MRFYFLLLLVMSISCSPKSYLFKELSAAEKEFHDHIGFMLYDVGAKKSVAEYNSAKYFTPASNTKIFTLYTSLKLLGDSIPAIKYVVRNDSLIFWGLGDPSFLYKNVFDNRRIYTFLRNANQKLFFSQSNFETNHLGSGWAWDDYNEYYSAERSPFTIYGNMITIGKKPNNTAAAKPLLFMNHFTQADTTKNKSGPVRGIDSNDITYYPTTEKTETWEVPFHYGSDLLVELLSDTLKKQVTEIDMPLPPLTSILKSIPADSLYTVLMKQSDNFIAEQLLLASAASVSDTLKPAIAIAYAMKNFLADLPDAPQWVDGSGLSRFNLFTPRSIVKLWEKLYAEVPPPRLFKLLAVGGQPGTLENLYKAEKPFVFGKTGSLSNNHCLSGFLITKTGKIFIFSFMNSNFVAPSREIRSMMQRVLTTLHNNY